MLFSFVLIVPLKWLLPPNRCEVFRQRRDLKIGTWGRKKIIRGHRGGGNGFC